jgi:histidinol-phosphate aminotransferase
MSGPVDFARTATDNTLLTGKAGRDMEQRLDRRSFLAAGLTGALAAQGLLPGRLAAIPRRGATPRMAEPIRLSSNENPLGIPESARKAMLEAMDVANRYPRGADALRAAIAAKHGVTGNRVVLGAGSTDVLRMVAQMMAEPGTRMIVPDPTFEHVAAYAAPFRIPIVKVPLRPDHTMDLEAMRQAARGARGQALMFLCNPNNPTGTVTPSSAVHEFIRASTEKFVFLVDEAYFDYVAAPGHQTMLPLALRTNVIVTRTFSKIHGLAGLRVGYGISNQETIDRLNLFATNNLPTQLGTAAALAALTDDVFYRRSLDVNRQSLEIAATTLRELDLEVLPSHTNFIMHAIRSDVQTYNTRMLEAGIMVGRPVPPMLRYSRVSLGLPSEMEQWAETLRSFRSRGWV